MILQDVSSMRYPTQVIHLIPRDRLSGPLCVCPCLSRSFSAISPLKMTHTKIMGHATGRNSACLSPAASTSAFAAVVLTFPCRHYSLSCSSSLRVCICSRRLSRSRLCCCAKSHVVAGRGELYIFIRPV